MVQSDARVETMRRTISMLHSLAVVYLFRNATRDDVWELQDLERKRRCEVRKARQFKHDSAVSKINPS